jgi:F-type H+-transporting ATPase subunit c
MKKILIATLLVLVAAPLFAATGTDPASVDLTYKGLAAIGSGIAALGAIGIGLIGKGAMDALARQPEMVNEIRSNMILVCALVEGAVFFGIVVGMLVVVL